MKYLVLIAILFLVHGCGPSVLSDYKSLLERQPKVVYVSPEDGGQISSNGSVEVVFSEPIDPETIDVSTLAIVKDAGGKGVDIAADVASGDTTGVEGSYEIGADFKTVTFIADGDYEIGAGYKVVATTKILSSNKIPLDCTGSANAFVSSFVVGGTLDSDENTDVDGDADGDYADDEDSEDEQVPDDVVIDVIARPKILLINEILYDVSGDDTNGVLFVELYGDPDSDIGNYEIVFVNGDGGAPTDSIKIPANSIIPSDGIYLIADAKTGALTESFVAGFDLIDNFDPQNGPDCVQLLDDTGKLIDALGYGGVMPAAAQNGLACHEGSFAAKAAMGQSLSRKDSLDTNDNSKDFTVLAAPSPGAI